MITILNQNIEIKEIIYFLKTRVELKKICTEFLQKKIINNAIEMHDIEITAEEIQAQGDQIRRKRNLEKAEDTFAWLDEQLITSEEWEAGIYDDLAAQKLADHLFSQAVQDFFNQNQHQFEQVLLYEIIIPDEKLAWEIFYQIEEQELSFHQAAHLYNIDPERRRCCGYVGFVHRHDLKPTIATQVFQATSGSILTPFPSEQGVHLFFVEQFMPAELTDDIYQTLLKQMFQNWLNQELNYMLLNQTDN